MPEDIYEIISLAMRYWFTALGVLIVWRSFSWLRKDRRLKHKRLRQLPDAGMIGELLVVQGSGDLEEDTLISLPREGVLGFLRANDVVVPAEGVAGQHIDFVFVSGQGVRMFPRRGCSCRIDGEEITDRRSAKANPMLHGSELIIGEAVLRLRFFAGVDAPSLAMEPITPEPMPFPVQPVSPYPPQPVQQPYQPSYPQQPYAPQQQAYQPPYPQQSYAPQQQASQPPYPQQPVYPPPMGYPPQQGAEPPYQQEDPMSRPIRHRRYAEDE